MRGVNLAGVNRVKSRNGSNLGALGISALGALSIGALGSFRADSGMGRRSRPPAARFSRPRVPDLAAGPQPPIWPPKSRPPRRRSSRTGPLEPPPAGWTWPQGRFDQAASRRAARQGPPPDKSHQANDWRMIRAHNQPAASQQWNLTKATGNLAKCRGSYAKSATSAGRRQRVYTPPATPPRRERKRESRRSAGRGPPRGSPSECRRPDRRPLILVSRSKSAEVPKMPTWRKSCARFFGGTAKHG